MTPYAISWTDTNPDIVSDAIIAPSLGKLDIKGDKKSGNLGAFQADIILDGTDPNARQTLGKATIAGPAGHIMANITGDVGSFAFKSDVSDSSFTVHSAVKKFSASGAMMNVTMDFEEFGSIAAASWDTGTLTAQFGKSLDLKSNKKANDPGNLSNVSLTLTGAPAPGGVKEALSKFTAKGATANVTANITGNVGSVDLSKGAVDGLMFSATEALKSLKLGDTSAASVTAGATGSLQAVRWLTGDVVLTDLKTLKTTGDKKTNIPGDAGINMTINEAGASTAKSALGSASIAGTLNGAWLVKGAVGGVAAGNVSNLFTGHFDGEVKALTSKAAFDGFAAAAAFGKVDVKTTMTGATIIAGGTPGSGANTIGTFKTGGAISGGTRILVGVDPVNGVFDDGDDVFKTGDANFIKSMTIGGDAAPDSVFAAGVFPKTVSINKVKVDPNNDPRFVVS